MTKKLDNTEFTSGWVQFSNIVDAFSNLDMVKLTSLNSIETSLISNVIRNSNASIFHFFVREQISDIEKAMLLKIFQQLKEYNYRLFFSELERVGYNIDEFLQENLYSNEEFTILEQIVGIYVIKNSLVKFCFI